MNHQGNGISCSWDLDNTLLQSIVTIKQRLGQNYFHYNGAHLTALEQSSIYTTLHRCIDDNSKAVKWAPSNENNSACAQM